MRGTVRSLARSEGYAHLTDLPNAAGRLELAAADLQTPGAFDAAVAGCDHPVELVEKHTLAYGIPQVLELDHRSTRAA